MPVIVGRKPSPRAIILDFPSPIAEAIAALFPTSMIAHGDPGVRLDEWDVVVVDHGTSGTLPSHLFLLSFGQGFLGFAQDMAVLSLSAQTVATEFAIPDGLESAVRRLVLSDLLPLVRGSKSNPAVTNNLRGSKGVADSGVFAPFLTTTEPVALAGAFPRIEGKAWGWVLPEGVDVVAWTAAAISSWRHIDPLRFPSGPDWRNEPIWQTPAEQSAASLATSIEAERETSLAALDQRATEAETALASAREAADQNERQLLTAQGPELVNAVIAALTAFGFQVQDMDDVWPAGDRREDLRITVADDPSWEVIGEVRGYAAGAQLNDLLRIGRFARRYLAERRVSPAATWYVANQFIREAPMTRPRILHSNPDEVEEFGVASGLCIDTRDLLRLWLDVQIGTRIPHSVRSLLVASRGRLDVP